MTHLHAYRESHRIHVRLSAATLCIVGVFVVSMMAQPSHSILSCLTQAGNHLANKLQQLTAPNAYVTTNVVPPNYSDLYYQANLGGVKQAFYSPNGQLFDATKTMPSPTQPPTPTSWFKSIMNRLQASLATSATPPIVGNSNNNNRFDTPLSSSYYVPTRKPSMTSNISSGVGGVHSQTNSYNYPGYSYTTSTDYNSAWDSLKRPLYTNNHMLGHVTIGAKQPIYKPITTPTSTTDEKLVTGQYPSASVYPWHAQSLAAVNRLYYDSYTMSKARFLGFGRVERPAPNYVRLICHFDESHGLHNLNSAVNNVRWAKFVGNYRSNQVEPPFQCESPDCRVQDLADVNDLRLRAYQESDNTFVLRIDNYQPISDYADYRCSGTKLNAKGQRETVYKIVPLKL
ncbi:hypothetical protein GZH46_00391 [Fragariocoptes setiger]|uniref:Uncharacterized protein n=1 Tax=Fragariocoptes setiger TaxID=1670756 RepID=A0ABQ7SCC2_9ACAR|nr:hypothetical protein GZH46_00391 [Fragariocoptes setiger]